MELEEVSEKLSNMHFDDIVKSYCNKVNDIERLKDSINELLKGESSIHRDTFVNKYNGKKAYVISYKMAGMCDATIGRTMVLYRIEGEGYYFTMDSKEFFQKHTELEVSK